MKYDIYIIICLIILVVGVVGIFYTADIVDKCRKIKKKSKVIQIGKTAGLVFAVLSLGLIYLLG